MNCPNCVTPMSLVTLDNQSVFHCGNCGGSFFAENGINRIDLTTAQKLAEDKRTDEVAGTDKKCPKDQTVLKPVSNEENVPVDVTLLRCPDCRGVFVYPDDLVKFKQAQMAKINYFKSWSLPLPALKAVLVLSLLAAIGLTLSSRYNLLQQFSNQTHATDVAKTVHVGRSGPYLFMSFRTPVSLRSAVIFHDKAANTTLTKIVSDKPSLIHYLTTTDLNLSNDLIYQIVLTDSNGKQSKTEELDLIFP